MKVIVVDHQKCSGSGECSVACAQALHKTPDKAYSAIRYIEGHLQVCDQCGECIAVCPTQALQRIKSGVVTVKKDLCVGCFMCVGFCGKRDFFTAPQKTEPVKCISCGKCVAACPKGALSLVEKDHSQLPA